jgi:hypothetical protein
MLLGFETGWIGNRPGIWNPRQILYNLNTTFSAKEHILQKHPI